MDKPRALAAPLRHLYISSLNILSLVLLLADLNFSPIKRKVWIFLNCPYWSAIND